tara:strand:+ start:1414 stop:1797 length:384 start_codon:yes stop_codon:yes gene_type:complete
MLKWLRKNYPIFVIIGACIIVFQFFNEKENYVNEYNAKIEALEKKVDSLHSENDELIFKIDTLNGQITQLDKQIDLKNSRINNLKYEINTKVNAVDDFNDSELEKFFTDRYRHYFDSIAKANSKASN